MCCWLLPSTSAQHTTWVHDPLTDVAYTCALPHLQAQISFSHPVQYINSAQIRLYTNALSSVLQSVAPELSEITAPTCTGGFVLPAPPFAPEPDATITSVYEVGGLHVSA